MGRTCGRYDTNNLFCFQLINFWKLHQVEPLLMLAAESHEVHAKQITDMRLNFFFFIIIIISSDVIQSL